MRNSGDMEHVQLSAQRTGGALKTRTQPFLMRFVSPVDRDGRTNPQPGTLYTFVARETTDDR